MNNKACMSQESHRMFRSFLKYCSVRMRVKCGIAYINEVYGLAIYSDSQKNFQ